MPCPEKFVGAAADVHVLTDSREGLPAKTIGIFQIRLYPADFSLDQIFSISSKVFEEVVP